MFCGSAWPDKAARDAGREKVVKDPRMDAADAMPFDDKRMIFGWFTPAVSIPA